MPTCKCNECTLHNEALIEVDDLIPKITITGCCGDCIQQDILLVALSGDMVGSEFQLKEDVSIKDFPIVNKRNGTYKIIYSIDHDGDIYELEVEEIK